MTVGREQLESDLRDLVTSTRTPNAGLFGPDSSTWLVCREAAVFLGGARAALMQLAHPFVAAAIEEHSSTREDLAGRFHRTFSNVFSMVFGDLEHATTSARRVHQVHQQIHGTFRVSVGPFAQGTRYEANDPASLLWVHSTLMDSALRSYELLLGPLHEAQKQSFQQESHRFSALFGIPEELRPRTWEDFQDYMSEMLGSATLTVSPEAKEIARFLFKAPSPSLAPLWRWYRLMTAAMLPERLREQYGLPDGIVQGLVAAGSLRALRSVYPRIPVALRTLPAYRKARRRALGQPARPELIGQLGGKLVLKALGGNQQPTSRPHREARDV